MELISFNDGKILIQPNLKLHLTKNARRMHYAFGTEI